MVSHCRVWVIRPQLKISKTVIPSNLLDRYSVLSFGLEMLRRKTRPKTWRSDIMIIIYFRFISGMFFSYQTLLLNECHYFQNSNYTFSSFLDRSLARIRATGEKTTWIRGDDVLMCGKNLFSLMKNSAEEEFSVNSNIISVENSMTN